MMPKPLSSAQLQIAAATTTKLRKATVLAATSFLAVREQPKGSNRSPDIDGWLASIGSPMGSAWCAAFVHHCGIAAAGTAYPFKRSGSVREVVQQAQKEGLAMPAKEARAGDLVAFYFSTLGRYAHIGIVVKNDGTTLSTIEGNTIADHTIGDTREGWGVFAKQRLITDKLLALRWPNNGA